MNTRFGRAFRYEVRNYFRAVAILWLVMALIPAAMLAITYFLAGETAMEGSFNGYSIAVGMFGLVLGMVGLRENQRVLNQNGVSRRSAFLADVAALAVAAVLFWAVYAAGQRMPARFCPALRRLAGWKEIDHTLGQYIEHPVQER